MKAQTQLRFLFCSPQKITPCTSTQRTHHKITAIKEHNLYKLLKLTTIPRPQSIDDNVDGDKKSPANIIADGGGIVEEFEFELDDNLDKNVCNLGKLVNSYTSLNATILNFSK